jgi:hypothetical protein
MREAQKVTGTLVLNSFFKEFFLLMTLADLPPLGNSAGGLNLYDGSSRNPLVPSD